MKNKVKIFYINLNSEAEKNKHMTGLCSSINLEFERIEAVNGKSLSTENINKICDENLIIESLGRKMSHGEVGCVKSHLLSLEKFLTSEYNHALILEDDVEFDFSATEVELLLSYVPDDFHVILLGHHPRYTRNRGAGLCFWERIKFDSKYTIGQFSEKPLGAYSYLVSRKGAMILLSDFEVIKRPFDWWNFKELNIYGVHPPVSKIADKFSHESTLSSERGNIKITRTAYQRIKDSIRKVMEKFSLIDAYFALNRFMKKLYKFNNPR